MQLRLGQIMAAAFLYGAIMLANWRISLTLAESEATNFMVWMTALHGCAILLGLLYGARHVRPIPEEQRWARRFVFGIGLLTPYLAVAAPVFLVWWQAERVTKRHAPPVTTPSNPAEQLTMRTFVYRFLGAAILFVLMGSFSIPVVRQFPDHMTAQVLFDLVLANALLVTLGFFCGSRQASRLPEDARLQRGVAYVLGLLTPYFVLLAAGGVFVLARGGAVVDGLLAVAFGVGMLVAEEMLVRRQRTRSEAVT